MSPRVQKAAILWLRLREIDPDAADAFIDRLDESLEAEERAQAERPRPQLRIVVDNT